MKAVDSVLSIRTTHHLEMFTFFLTRRTSTPAACQGTSNGGRQFLRNRRSIAILYPCMANLTVYLLKVANLRTVDLHWRYPGNLRSSSALPNVCSQCTSAWDPAQRRGAKLLMCDSGLARLTDDGGRYWTARACVKGKLLAGGLA